MLKIRSVHLP